MPGSRSQLDRIDKGSVRHPVFGHRDRWVDEDVTPGFWSKTLEGQRDQVAAKLEDEIGNLLRDLAKG